MTFLVRRGYILQVRIDNALNYHREGLFISGPGCVTCRVGVTVYGSFQMVPAPWPCDTYKALTGDES
jgi:hypothetical protein